MKQKKGSRGVCRCGGRFLTPAEHRIQSARYRGDISTRQICDTCGLLPLNNTDYILVSRRKAKKILAACCQIDKVYGFHINAISKEITGSVYKAIQKLLENGFKDKTIEDVLLKNLNKYKVSEILKEELY